LLCGPKRGTKHDNKKMGLLGEGCYINTKFKLIKGGILCGTGEGSNHKEERSALITLIVETPAFSYIPLPDQMKEKRSSGYKEWRELACREGAGHLRHLDGPRGYKVGTSDQYGSRSIVSDNP